MGTRNGKSELVEGICNGLIEYDFEGVRTRFLPEDVIHNLINEASVRNELNSKARCLVQSLTSRGPDELTKFITNSKDPAKKVFAAAILANIKDQELRNSMRGFRDKKFTDKDLPLREGSDILEKRSYDLFQEKQFQVSAHIFTEPECEKDFRVKLNTFSIFPFEEVESKIGAGAFSKVYKVRIHKSHQTVSHLSMGTESLLMCPQFHEKQEWFAIKSITADSLDCKATESAFNQEAQALYETSQLKHPNIVRAFAAISRGKGRYFLFEWANKGSLDDFYKSKEPELSRGYIRNIVSQLLGLANAIRRLHHFGGGESYRHGDLKPANILCFGDDNDSIGRWKISDLGLAKHHMEVTALRGPTQTRHSTIRYEAPETTTLQQGGRSRQYDMWSLGCITLELIVWLLYGHKGRDAFNQDIGDNSYYEVHDTGAVVHPSVKFWMDHIQENDPECSCESSALRDLLGMVNKKLIVVAVNPGSNTSEEYSVNTSEHPVTVTVMQPDSGGPVQQQSYRSTAKDFDNALRNMTNQHQDHDDPYWFTGARRDQVQRPVIPKQRQRHGTYLKVADAMKPPPRQREPGLQPSHTGSSQDYKHPPLNIDVWKFEIDNTFAKETLRRISLVDSEPVASQKPAQLCPKCSKMKFWEPAFKIEERALDLETQSTECDFCRLRLEVCPNNASERKKDSLQIRFDLEDSVFKLAPHNKPVLSLLRKPKSELAPVSMSNIQIGVSQLAKTGSKAQLEIIRQWLEHCDKNHSECCPAALSTSGFSIPTRLVDVGEPQCPSIKLVKTKPGDQMRYIALSHQWGKLKHFCTTMQNIEHHRDKINMHELPSTFRDAVNVTRGLGIRYIWIDSICIIQGADGDFHQEAPKMEGVFSSAYVVLAASSSDGQNDGFLKERGSRQCIRILHENMPDFYIGHFIDDFTKDVIDSPLNKRGWVLQERALARRTIYFTHTQTYWECGQGVHCETFRKMHNELSSFIGDPNFPMVALKSTRGARIRLFQNLYRQYSRLDFTRDYDRPLAIAGLEKRLIQAFNTSGGFGIFDDGRGLLRRSLLWYRSSIDTPLKLIQFPNDWKLKVPSWSWMAYQGGIEYLELPFQGVDWLLEEMTPPWCTSETTSTWRTGDEEEVPELHAVARSFDLGRMGRSTRGEAHAIYDRPVGGTKPNSSHNSVKCVVMGRLRDPAQIERNRRHYVLLVREGISGGQRQRRPVWERVGVGYLPGGWISLNDDGMDVVVR